MLGGLKLNLIKKHMLKSELIKQLQEIDKDFEVVLANEKKIDKSEGQDGYRSQFEIVLEEYDDEAEDIYGNSLKGEGVIFISYN